MGPGGSARHCSILNEHCGNNTACAQRSAALHLVRDGAEMRPTGPHRKHPTRTVLQLDGSRGFDTPGIGSIGHTARSQTGKQTRRTQQTHPSSLGRYRTRALWSIFEPLWRTARGRTRTERRPDPILSVVLRGTFEPRNARSGHGDSPVQFPARTRLVVRTRC